MRALTNDVSDKAPSSRSANASNDVSPISRSTPWQALHQTLGNQGVQRLLRAGAVQAKLSVSAPGDPFEQEADDAAERVMRMETPDVGGDRSAPSVAPIIQRRVSEGAGRLTGAPPLVHEVLRSPGQPLDPSTRDFMESRFGCDFRNVRVHSNARAAESARAVNARAYAIGSNIAFDRGGYSPHSVAGRRLLAHELTHVIQQSGTGPAPGIEHEHDADRAAADVVADRAVRVLPNAQIALQRQEKEETQGAEKERPGGGLERAVANFILRQCGLDNAQARIAAAALTGMIVEMVEQLGRGGKGALFLSRLAGYSLKDSLKFTGGYAVGLVEGIVSPITDLFGLAVFGEHMRVMAENLLLSGISRRGELAEDLRQLFPSLDEIQKGIDAVVASIRDKPVEVLKAVMTLPQRLSAQAEEMAYSLGRKAGAEIVKSLEEPWSEKKTEEAPGPDFLRQPLAWVSSKAGALESKIIEAPWAKIGNKVGYAVGFAAINIALFAFTDGIGNLITQLGNALGKVSKALGALGRGLEAIAGVTKTVGTAVAEIEKLIALGVGKLLKPLEHILEPILTPLTGFLGRLRTFLRKLFGVVEKEAAPALTAATTKGAGALEDVTKAVHTPAPKTPVRTAHASPGEDVVFHESVTPPVEKVRRPAVKVEEPGATAVGESTGGKREGFSDLEEQVLDDLAEVQQKLYPEKGPSGKHTQSAASEERALLEQDRPSNKQVKKARIEESARLGEAGGREQAAREGIAVAEWDTPQQWKGDFGQGIDRIGERGDRVVVLEFKYGGSDLGTSGEDVVQMSNEWIGRKIAELEVVGDTETAAKLLKAAQEGRLQGVVYWTRELKAGETTSRLTSAQLRDKLGRESISESGLIQYSRTKVQSGYDKRLQELRRAMERGDVSRLP